MGKTYEAYTYHILFRLLDTYMIINLPCTIEKKLFYYISASTVCLEQFS